MRQKQKYFLKRIRRGAYECRELLVVRSPWISERWDGPREKFREWKVFTAGSTIEKRLLLDAFRSRSDALHFVERFMNRGQGE